MLADAVVPQVAFMAVASPLAQRQLRERPRSEIFEHFFIVPWISLGVNIEKELGYSHGMTSIGRSHVVKMNSEHFSNG